MGKHKKGVIYRLPYTAALSCRTANKVSLAKPGVGRGLHLCPALAFLTVGNVSFPTPKNDVAFVSKLVSQVASI